MPDIEAGRQKAAAENLRACMRLFPTGVALLTAGEGESATAMTVNSVVSVSLVPPTVLVSVHQQARITEHVAPGMEFAVCFLGTDHADLTRRFAARDRPVGEAAVTAMRGTRAANGAPIPDEALGVLECDVERTVPVGDHVLVIGLVVRAQPGSGDCPPQVFHRGDVTTVLGAAAPTEKRARLDHTIRIDRRRTS